jgi:hypothetical protein
MLINFDQSTIANMTAALEYTCKRLPAEHDNHQNRKRIAEAVKARAKAGPCTYVDLERAGLNLLNEIVQPRRFNLFGLDWLSSISAPWRD